MGRKVYGTLFESKQKVTHKVTNVEDSKDLIKGTKAECLAFLCGLEYADNSMDSVWYDCELNELVE